METKKKLLVIVNPFSGTGSKEQVPQLAVEALGAKFDVEVALLEAGVMASDLARRAVEENYYGVIAVGGDGTVNGVAGALIGTPVALGIVPCGSGNGLARHLKIPINFKKAFAHIAQDNVEVCDYCTVNGIPFVCTCGMGFDAAIADRYARANKRGPINYVKTALSVYAHYSPIHCRLALNGEEIEEDVFVVTCANASQYGNNAFIAPHASLQDGLLDVTVIKPFSMIESPIVGGSLFTKSVDRNRHVDTYQCTEIKVAVQEPTVFHIDGEPMDEVTEMNVKCHPQGIKIFV